METDGDRAAISGHDRDSPELPAGELLTPAVLARCSSSEARALLPFELAQKLRALPLALSGSLGSDPVVCAVPATAPKSIERDLQFALSRAVRCIPLPEATVARAIAAAYHGDEQRFKNDLTALQRSVPVHNSLPEGGALRSAAGEPAQFVATLLEYAVAQGASDLHLIPRRDGCYARVRVNGELRVNSAPLCPLSLHRNLITRLKVLAGLDTTATHRPLDGAFVIPQGGGLQVSARLSIMPTVHGEKAVVRFRSCDAIRSLDALGLSRSLRSAIDRFLARTAGAAIVAGPTGSGKSTTIGAMLAALAEESRSVVSIEDPVEIEIPGVSQTSLDLSRGLDYPTSLRAVLRQDPNVIALGEIRDRESAAAVFQAALTGHLVISTVHARNAAEVVQRLQHLGVDPLTIAQALRLVVCQRLVPTLCRGCKVIDLAASGAAKECVYRPVGCARCDYSGFWGRQLAAEWLMPSPDTGAIIASTGELPRMFPTADRYQSLDAELGELLALGLITPAQRSRYVDD